MSPTCAASQGRERKSLVAETCRRLAQACSADGPAIVRARTKTKSVMAIARCEKHPFERVTHYAGYALPLGFPETAAICGRPGCENAARILARPSRVDAATSCGLARVRPRSGHPHSRRRRTNFKLRQAGGCRLSPWRAFIQEVAEVEELGERGGAAARSRSWSRGPVLVEATD